MPFNVKGECRNTGKTHFKKGIVPWNKGKVMTKEYCNRVSKVMMGRPSPRKGVKLSEDTKSRIKNTLLLRNAGKPHHDGHVYQNAFWKALRKLVYQRDGWKCQECGCAFGIKHRPAAHHIDYNPNNNDLSNLISLCSSCHSKANGKREYWINYYKEKIKIIIKRYNTGG